MEQIFEESACCIIETAWSVCNKIKLQFITKELFFLTVFALPNMPFVNYLKNQKNLSDEEIAKRRSKVYDEFFYSHTQEYQIVPYAFYDSVDQEMQIDEELLNIFEEAGKIARKWYAKDSIGVQDFMIAIAQKYSDIYEKIVDIYLPEYASTHTALEKGDKNLYNITIPSSLASFLTVLNNMDIQEDSECHICGRDEETKAITRILMKHNKPNVVMVGEPGVGKTAIVEKFVWMIDTGNCPEQFKNSIVVSLDVNSIVAGTMYRGSAEERFKGLIDFLEENKNCILFIDEIHLLLGAGACRDGDLDLANALKPILARGDTKVIGATTSFEYEKYFSKDAALKRRFEKIVVNEPHSNEVYDMIKNQIKILEKVHHTSISRELVDTVIFKASCFNFTTNNPDRTLDLLDKTMVCAELEGRYDVTEADILENFNINQKKFEKMNTKIKWATAYHEAGHYIAHKFSSELIDYVMLAVSIMPAEDYLGVNVFEIDHDITPTRNRDYFIQTIGTKLAGRIAEKMYTNSLTAGASADLEQATRIAKDIVTKYGLDEGFTQDRVFLKESENEMYTDDIIEKINGRIDAILKEAHEYTEKLLNSKRKYLDALAGELVEKGMLSDAEIQELFEKVTGSITVKGRDYL